jgi:predicted N-acetyltransferase YhbS
MTDSALTITRLPAGSPFIPAIAEAQFAFWGPLTGHQSLMEYEQFLHLAAGSPELPAVLIATRGPTLAGSVNLLEREMTIRPNLIPWLSQLFVAPKERNRNVGATLTDAALCEATKLGYSRLHLFTSGTLPNYYASLGWKNLEMVEYLGKPRTIMMFDLFERRDRARP